MTGNWGLVDFREALLEMLLSFLFFLSSYLTLIMGRRPSYIPRPIDSISDGGEAHTEIFGGAPIRIVWL